MQSILKEVESVKSFTKTRDGLPGGVNDVVMQGMVSSIIKQLNAVKGFWCTGGSMVVSGIE